MSSSRQLQPRASCTLHLPSPTRPLPPVQVGIVHTRLRAPETPMAFRLTCQLCSLWINGLQVRPLMGSVPCVTSLSYSIAQGPYHRS